MVDAFQYDFFRFALMASVLGGTVCGIVGVWVVMMRIPFVGVALSHAAFAGCIFGILFGLPQLLAAFFFCLIVSLLIGPVAERAELEPNVSIGILFSLVLGAAFLGMGMIRGAKTQALNLMWGNILLLDRTDILGLLFVTLFVILFVVLFYKEIQAVLFNRELAKANGIPEKGIFYALLIITGLCVSLNLKTVGGLLIFSLIINPPSAAYQLTYGLKKMYLLSIAFAILSCLSGIVCSYYLNLPAGASVILISSLIFLLSTAFSPKKKEEEMKRADFFNAHADSWDSKQTDMEIHKARRLLTKIRIKKHADILDIGCGTGILLPLIKEVFEQVNAVISLDIAISMLQQAKKKYNDSCCIQADVHKLPLSSESFDAVLLLSCFPHFQDKLKALSEVYRVLRTNGKAYILHTISRKDVNALHGRVGGVVAGDILPSGSELFSLLEKAGFINTNISENPNSFFAMAEKSWT